ncbi:MAG: AraC family transcriptional regulator [Alistipes sp.]|nr:AraC family transcriptional regulator [Alistipes sp.]
MKERKQHEVLNTIERCNAYFGIAMSHPMVSIVDLSKVRRVDIAEVKLNLYAVVCTSGHVRFYAPGHISKRYNYDSLNIGGWILIFHPDLLEDTLLAQRMSEYAFFDNKVDAALQVTESETAVINNCILSLKEELRNDTDRYSRRILVAGIAVLLSICMRYAERQPMLNITSNKNVVARLNTLLNYRISHPSEDKALFSVAECARELGISPNYLGDLVRKQAGCSAKQYIQNHMLNEVKLQLSRSNHTVSQIAIDLGFKYAHHLTRLFKRMTGITPNEYRKQMQENNN